MLNPGCWALFLWTPHHSVCQQGNEHGPTHYEQDVSWMVSEMGFDGVFPGGIKRLRYDDMLKVTAVGTKED